MTFRLVFSPARIRICQTDRLTKIVLSRVKVEFRENPFNIRFDLFAFLNRNAHFILPKQVQDSSNFFLLDLYKE